MKLAHMSRLHFANLLLHMSDLHLSNLFLAHVSILLSKSRIWKEKLGNLFWIFNFRQDPRNYGTCRDCTLPTCYLTCLACTFRNLL